MTKQDFIKTLKELKKITDELERLRDLKRTTFLEQDFYGSNDLGILELETLVIDTLKRAMNDTWDWTSPVLLTPKGRRLHILDTSNRALYLD